MYWLFTKMLYLIEVFWNTYTYLCTIVNLYAVYTLIGLVVYVSVSIHFPMFNRSMTHKSLINWSPSSIINHDAETYLQLLIGAEWKTWILSTDAAGIAATTIVFWFTGPVKSHKNNFITLLIQQRRQNKLQSRLCFLEPLLLLYCV